MSKTIAKAARHRPASGARRLIGASIAALLIGLAPAASIAQEASGTEAGAVPGTAATSGQGGLIGDIYAQNFPGGPGPLGPDVFHIRFGRFSTMPASAARVQAVMTRILARNGLPRNFATADVIACDAASGMANPVHHRVMICRGLIPYLETEDALAFALSHEVAHVLLQHRVEKRSTFGTSEKSTRMNLESLAILGGIAAGGVPGVLIGAGIAASEHGVLDTMQQGKLNSFDRQEEADADRIAIELTSQAGYNPAAGADLLDRVGGMLEVAAKPKPTNITIGRMRDGTPDLAAATLDLLSAASSQAVNLARHPDADARIAAVTETIQAKYADTSDRKMKPLGLDREVQAYSRALASPSIWKADPAFAEDVAMAAIARGDGRTAIAAINAVPATSRRAGGYLTQAAAAELFTHDHGSTLRFANQYYRAVRPFEDKYLGHAMSASWYLRDTSTFAKVTDDYCNLRKQENPYAKCEIKQLYPDMEGYSLRHGKDQTGTLVEMIQQEN